MSGAENDVVALRGDQVEWRINGLEMRMDSTAALQLALKALETLGWEPGQQIGLSGPGSVLVYPDERTRTDMVERLRASGQNRVPEKLERMFMAAPWGPAGSQPVVNPARPRTRRLVKESPESDPSPTAKPKRTTKKAAAALLEDEITGQLFEDPVDQLRYEVHHAYLLTVPISQRKEWPIDLEYRILPSFMADLDEQSGKSVSRQQIIQTIVDVVCRRVNDVRSRKVHPLREGNGMTSHTDNPPVTRSFDRAVAYRAYVSAGTPQARRIMWWRTPAGGIDLARLANHDDMAMPER